MYNITLIPGDGVGPEIVQSVREIIAASGVQVKWEEVTAGLKAEKVYGTPLPQHVFESIAKNKLVLKGPTATPFGGNYQVVTDWKNTLVPKEEAKRTYPSITVALRNELGMFANVRPVKSYPGIPSRYSGIDLLLFRENTEDLYLGKERKLNDDAYEAIKVISRSASQRIAQFAYDYMARLERKKMTIVHKANIMKKTDGLFLQTCQEVGESHSDIATNHRAVDAICMDLVIEPEQYDGLLMPNLYGDIISDLAAGLVGGLGLAPGANFGPYCAEFEAAHGTAPDIAGKGIVNPTAMILTGVMMLRHLRQYEAAAMIEDSITEVLQERKNLTPDLGGEGTTMSMTEAIIEKMETRKKSRIYG